MASDFQRPRMPNLVLDPYMGNLAPAESMIVTLKDSVVVAFGGLEQP